MTRATASAARSTARRTTLFSALLFGLTLLALRLPAVAEEREPPLETATFSMYCYWTGEATLGRVDGVEASRIGHWGGNEIVQVDYDPSRTDVASLVKALESRRSFYAVVVADDAEGRRLASELDGATLEVARGHPRFIEPKHSLRTKYPALAALDLSESQRIALNSWSYFGGPMPDVLTAEQRAALER